MKRNPSVGTAALAQYPRIAGWFKPRFGKAWILQNFATRSTFCQWRRLSTRELISLHHNLFKSESDWKQKINNWKGCKTKTCEKANWNSQ